MTHPFDPPRPAGCLRLCAAIIAAGLVLGGLLAAVDYFTRDAFTSTSEVQR